MGNAFSFGLLDPTLAWKLLILFVFDNVLLFLLEFGPILLLLGMDLLSFSVGYFELSLILFSFLLHLNVPFHNISHCGGVLEY